jgi:hypothetical protein
MPPGPEAGRFPFNNKESHMARLTQAVKNHDRVTQALRRYQWLLSELHGGNSFSKDQLWAWLQDAERALAIHQQQES